MDKLGPICKGVIALAFDAICGPDGKDRTVFAARGGQLERELGGVAFRCLKKDFEPPQAAQPLETEESWPPPEEKEKRARRTRCAKLRAQNGI
jgi:hypothetical protein